MRRRDFLTASVMTGTAALGTSIWTRRGNALPFGEVPLDKTSSMLPETLKAENVLECFLLGGLTPWTSTYCVPGRGEATQTFAYAQYAEMLDAAERCEIQGASDPFSFFAQDSAGLDVCFGLSMNRLLARPDVLKRLRLVVTRHRLGLHELAMPLMTTGRTLGNPACAALATHVNRYFVDRDVGASHAPPFSYVVSGSGDAFTFGETRNPFLLQGLHPGPARPLLLELNDTTRLDELSSRAALGTPEERAAYDALLGRYFDQYSRRLRFGADAEVVRAERFDDLRRAVSKERQADVIRSVLPQGYSAPWEPFPALCGSSSSPQGVGNRPAMSLRLATHLLTHPVHRARYCTVVDTGYRRSDGGGGYDTHSEDAITQTLNLHNFLSSLTSFVNQPGESDPAKLDLDKTMIILNTEFGRTPERQGGPSARGRNHWPHGFAQIYIGGPIREGQAGIYGHIGEDGYASEFATPAENRIAALLALGIYPFEAHGYSSGDVQGEMDEAPAARSVIRRVLGHEI